MLRAAAPGLVAVLVSVLVALLVAGCGLALPGQSVVIVVNRDAVPYRADVALADFAPSPYTIPADSTVVLFRAPIEATTRIAVFTADCTLLLQSATGAGASANASETHTLVIEGGSVTTGAETGSILSGFAQDGDEVCPVP